MTERRYRDMIKAVERDTAGAGVEFDFIPGNKHVKVWLRKGGKERLVVMSASASDRRAERNRVHDVRRAIRELTGAG